MVPYHLAEAYATILCVVISGYCMGNGFLMWKSVASHLLNIAYV